MHGAAWEIEKNFVLVIYDVIGYPASIGNGEISIHRNNRTIRVQILNNNYIT